MIRNTRLKMNQKRKKLNGMAFAAVIAVKIFVIILLSSSCMKIQLSPMDTSQGGIEGLIASVSGYEIAQAIGGKAPSLVYSGSPYTLVNNVAISTITPVMTGTPSSCTSSPALPAGLSINNANCAITGTPSVLQAAAVYSITAVNSYGSETAAISIAVVQGYSVGGWVTGMYGGSVVLQNNAGDDVTVSANGPFVFPTTIAPGAGIRVTVKNQPSPQTCSVYADETGTLSPSLTMPASDFLKTSVVCGPMSLPLADSGMNACFSAAGAIIACGSAPLGQDAEYVNIPAARSFTGPTQHPTYTSDYTSTDNVTGLVWKTCEQGKTGAACTGVSSNTASPLDAGLVCRNLNQANAGAGYAGRTDWRIPTRRELESLQDYYHSLTSVTQIDPTAFPNSNTIVWSADRSLSGGNWWSVGFNWLMPILRNTGVGSASSRCVSGGNGSPTAYTDNADGSVTDQKTGLIWQKCSQGLNNDAVCSGTTAGLTWTNALAYCEGLTLASRSDWRLPGAHELKSLADTGRANPSIDSSFFPGTISNWYWTSNGKYGGNTPHVLHFGDGQLNQTGSFTAYPVRCVTGP